MATCSLTLTCQRVGKAQTMITQRPSQTRRPLSHIYTHTAKQQPPEPFRTNSLFLHSIPDSTRIQHRDPQTNSQRIELSTTTSTRTRTTLYYTEETNRQKNATDPLHTRHSQEDSESAFEPTNEQKCRYSRTFFYFHSPPPLSLLHFLSVLCVFYRLSHQNSGKRPSS